MSIIELLNTRLTGLQETKKKLELNLQPLQSTNEEIALIERMMGLADFQQSEPVEDTSPSTNERLYEALQSLIVEE